MGWRCGLTLCWSSARSWRGMGHDQWLPDYARLLGIVAVLQFGLVKSSLYSYRGLFSIIYSWEIAMQSPHLLYVVSVNPDIRMLTCGCSPVKYSTGFGISVTYLPPLASMHRLEISSTNRYTLNTYEIAIITSRRPINLVPRLFTTTTSFHLRLIHCHRLLIPLRTLYRLQPPPVYLYYDLSVYVHSS